MPESSIVDTMCFPSDVNKAEVGLRVVLRLEAAKKYVSKKLTKAFTSEEKVNMIKTFLKLADGINSRDYSDLRISRSDH